MVNDQEHLADIGPMLHIVMLSPAPSSQKVSCPILPTGKEQEINNNNNDNDNNNYIAKTSIMWLMWLRFDKQFTRCSVPCHFDSLISFWSTSFLDPLIIGCRFPTPSEFRQIGRFQSIIQYGTDGMRRSVYGNKNVSLAGETYEDSQSGWETTRITI